MSGFISVWTCCLLPILFTSFPWLNWLESSPDAGIVADTLHFTSLWIYVSQLPKISRTHGFRWYCSLHKCLRVSNTHFSGRSWLFHKIEWWPNYFHVRCSQLFYFLFRQLVAVPSLISRPASPALLCAFCTSGTESQLITGSSRIGLCWFLCCYLHGSPRGLQVYLKRPLECLLYF